MSTDDHKALVRQVYDAINAHDVDAFRALLADDVVAHTPFPERASGADGYVEVFREVLAAFPDYRVEIADQIAEGDKVVTRYTVTATQQGEFMGVAASGQPVELVGIDIDRIAGGKVAEHWSEAGADGLGVSRGLPVAR